MTRLQRVMEQFHKDLQKVTTLEQLEAVRRIYTGTGSPAEEIKQTRTSLCIHRMAVAKRRLAIKLYINTLLMDKRRELL